jgi:hypothetical protein
VTFPMSVKSGSGAKSDAGTLYCCMSLCSG